MKGRLVPRTELTPATRDAMRALLDQHFAGVTAEQFTADLAEKNWIILLDDEHGQLRGFTTLHVYETAFRGERLSVVYSGDTIVDREAWGSRTLLVTWLAAVMHLRQTYPHGRYYWLLLSSGFRTYRFLPVFWREFFPRFDAVTPPETQALLDHLTAERFRDRYDRNTGIVRFDRPQMLRDGLRDIPAERLSDPHIAFFAARNIGHVAGDELVTLTEMTPENLTNAGRRMLVAGSEMFAPEPVAS